MIDDGRLEKWALLGMLDPYEPSLVRRNDEGFSVISYGQSSYGYDIRLSPLDFKVFKRIPGEIVNPKCFNYAALEDSELFDDAHGKYFILPGHSYGLGVSVERLKMPSDAMAVCVGKSTYARCGVIANLTPVEASWEGYLTLEFSNSSPSDVRLYANEGCAQLIFFQGDQCQTTYSDREGKYQDQGPRVTLAKV